MEQAEDGSVEGQRLEMSVGGDGEGIGRQGPIACIYIAAMERNVYLSGKDPKAKFFRALDLADNPNI